MPFLCNFFLFLKGAGHFFQSVVVLLHFLGHGLTLHGKGMIDSFNYCSHRWDLLNFVNFTDLKYITQSKCVSHNSSGLLRWILDSSSNRYYIIQGSSLSASRNLVNPHRGNLHFLTSEAFIIYANHLATEKGQWMELTSFSKTLIDPVKLQHII